MCLSSIRFRVLVPAVVALVLASACSGPWAPAATPTTAAPPATTVVPAPTGVPVVRPTAALPKSSSGAVLINGAGASFPYPLYSRWFYEYTRVASSARFNYQSIGSGGGISQIKARTVDFAGSDAILKPEDYREVAPARLQMLPTVAGAVVLAYNIKEIDKAQTPLVLDADTVAGIYLGKINKWNDPAIAALNPSLPLPKSDIIVVHRSDGSGTTAVFTDYLAKANETWKAQVGSGTSVRWPLGLGGKGNEGVAGVVSQNEGAIGYVELAFARQIGLRYANLKNSAGNVVEASAATVQNAMADTALPDTLAVSIANAPGKDSWPIASYTYLIVYMEQDDCAKAQALLGFMSWALSDAGSRIASELDYVPLAAKTRDLVLQRLSQMTCQGKVLM